MRARYYGSGFGRFLSRDVWEGDANQPMSYNAWLYVFDDPADLTDPTGRYGSRVHEDLTYDQALDVGETYARGLARAVVNEAAEWIAYGDLLVDESWSMNPLIGAPQLHFEPRAEAWGDLFAAIALDEPTLMGAALHEVQDWYSHWNEGYRWWPYGIGHAYHSLQAGCVPLLGCQRAHALIEQFYDEHPERELRQDLAGFYSAASVQSVSRDKLIDLYLYTYTSPGSTARDWWGYDTDHYFGFTPRDTSMASETRVWLMDFYWNLDDCAAVALLSGYLPPGEETVRSFLLTREFEP